MKWFDMLFFLVFFNTQWKWASIWQKTTRLVPDNLHYIDWSFAMCECHFVQVWVILLVAKITSVANLKSSRYLQPATKKPPKINKQKIYTLSLYESFSHSCSNVFRWKLLGNFRDPQTLQKNPNRKNPPPQCWLRPWFLKLRQNFTGFLPM